MKLLSQNPQNELQTTNESFLENPPIFILQHVIFSQNPQIESGTTVCCTPELFSAFQ